MGVLESIRVKQVNFPFRKKYEEFYRLFELLSPAYSEGRYDLLPAHVKASRDWKDLSMKIVDRVFSPLSANDLTRMEPKRAFGNTQILLMGELKIVLEKSKAKAVSIIILSVTFKFYYRVQNMTNSACFTKEHTLSQ